MSWWTGSPVRPRSTTSAARTSARRRTGLARGGGGFTLLEVLVAFTVLALSLGVLFQIFSTGMRASRAAEEHTRAALLAESKLAAIGVEQALVEGETAGDFGNGYDWRVNIRPYFLEGEEEAQEGLPSPIAAFEIVVTVSWGTGDAARSVSLTTLRVRSAASDQPGAGTAP